MEQELSASLEDYLEAVYQTIRDRRVARTKDIAAHLNVRMPSVTVALRLLAARNLIEHEPYGVIHLTPEGERAAAKLDRTHSILRSFLHEVLSIPLPEANETACKVEHVISDTVLNRFVSFLEFVNHCPHFSVAWNEDSGFRCQRDARGERCLECPGPLARPAI